MNTIGQEVARELTAQFYQWELRGRGWVVWPHAVLLEPPFRPFPGHFLRRRFVVDDGRIESFGSRFASSARRFLGFSEEKAIESQEEEWEEPEAESSDFDSGVVELEVRLPPDYQPSAPVFEQFIFSIGYVSGPIAFEVIGKEGEILVQLACRAADAPIVERQLQAYFPEAVVVSGSGNLDLLRETDIDEIEVVEFGLEREFMVPINNLKALPADPLVSICGALDRLNAGEAGIFQVLLEPARCPWAPSMMRAVTLGDRPFFENDPELVSQTRLKVSRPLFAAAVRILVLADSRDRRREILRSLSGALRPLRAVQGNQLVPLESDPLTEGVEWLDVLLRETHRPGMVLNSEEVVALVHLPTTAVRARNLSRVTKFTKAAPRDLVETKEGVCLGVNEHEGVSRNVWLLDSRRLNHCHILGGTGSGKSTILSQMACQDIQAGRGVAVIDPHGDLIDLLLPHIPKERLKDVILFDPTDEEYAVAFNPLAAGSERERDLLATDFIAVMKQNTSAWGDQMSSLLGNAVLAFLHSTCGGTLPELRRFLSDKEFQADFLKSITNQEVVYFWECEAKLANKTAVGSILTRLDSLLRYESLLHILGQRENRLDFAEIMDGGKIFLARLPKGLIGEENAFLLGSLLVSRFYQTTIARQSRSRTDRRPYFLLLDEAADQLTSTVSEILRGTRKYGLGLTLAHQSLADLKHDPEIYGAVTGNCGNKFCFQVGGDDARKLAEEFGGFSAQDLMNLPPRLAAARVGTRDRAFNLEVSFLPEAPRDPREAYEEVLSLTRAKYSTLRSGIREELAKLRGTTGRGRAEDPFAKLQAKKEKERKDAVERAPEPVPAAESASEELPLAKGKQPSQAIKLQVIQAACAWGMSFEREPEILSGATKVDLVLSLDSLRIAVQIAVSSPIDLEVENLKRCLDAGFEKVALLCDATVKRQSIATRFEAAYGPRDKVSFSTVRQFCRSLSDIVRSRDQAETVEVPPKEMPGTVVVSQSDKEALVAQQLREIQERIRRAKRF